MDFQPKKIKKIVTRIKVARERKKSEKAYAQFKPNHHHHHQRVCPANIAGQRDREGEGQYFFNKQSVSP